MTAISAISGLAGTSAHAQEKDPNVGVAVGDAPADFTGIETGGSDNSAQNTSVDFTPPVQAALELPDAIGLQPGVGVRVGGYGFREVASDDAGDWTDCRMDGVGIFGTLSFDPAMFGEAAIDYYQSTGGAVDDTKMDRMSLSVMFAFGYRAFADSVVSPYVQLGGGAEYSAVEWLDAAVRRDGVNPMGFFGIGGDVKIGDHVRLGMNLRIYLMAAFAPQRVEGDHVGHDHVHLPTDEEVGAAGQAQFFGRFDL